MRARDVISQRSAERREPVQRSVGGDEKTIFRF
jgi:hypothetical protein